MADVSKVWEPISETVGARFKPGARPEAPSPLFASLVKSDLPLGHVFDPRHLGDTIALDKDGIIAAQEAQRLTPGQLSALRKGYAAKLAAYEGQLGKVFQEKEISSSPPPALKLLASGRVEVAGTHPDRQKIEKLFEVDGALRDGLADLGAAAAKIRAAELAATGTKVSPFLQVAFDGARIKQDVEQRAAGRYGNVATPTDAASTPKQVDKRA